MPSSRSLSPATMGKQLKLSHRWSPGSQDEACPQHHPPQHRLPRTRRPQTPGLEELVSAPQKRHARLVTGPRSNLAVKSNAGRKRSLTMQARPRPNLMVRTSAQRWMLLDRSLLGWPPPVAAGSVGVGCRRLAASGSARCPAVAQDWEDWVQRVAWRRCQLGPERSPQASAVWLAVVLRLLRRQVRLAVRQQGSLRASQLDRMPDQPCRCRRRPVSVHPRRGQRRLRPWRL